MKDDVGVKSVSTRKLALFIAATIILSSLPMVKGDSWPTFLHDNESTGFSQSKAPMTNDTLWTVPSIGGNGYSSPSVANGRVFVNRGGSGILYALWADNGTQIWTQSIGSDGYRSSSAAVCEGKVYIVGSSLFCFYENNGTEVFNKSLSGNGVGTSSPTISDGRLFVFTQTLYCLYANNGTEIWTKNIGGNNGMSTPAVSGDKLFVNGGNSNYLYCLYASNGTDIWNFTGGGFANTPVIANGKVFYNPSNFYCLYENNGTVIWTRSAAGDGYSTPAVAFDKVYVHTTNRLKCYFQENGSIVFSVRLEDGSGSSSPSISASGNVYILTTRDLVGGVLYCINGNNGVVIWSHVTGGNGYSTVAIYNETLIVNEGTIYCFGNYALNTDYILIRDGPDGTGNNLCDPANHLTLPVGETVTLYGAAYNYSAPGDGYISNAPIFLYWFSGDEDLATVTFAGINSTITISDTDWGNVIITIDDYEGHLNSTQITVLEPVKDYVLIRDQSNGQGINLCDPTNYPNYPRGFTTTFYGALYNNTVGYLGDILPSSTWTSENISFVTVSSPGNFSNIDCSSTNFGSAEITLNASGISNTTIITVLNATIDYVQIRDAPWGGGVDLGIPINYPSYPVGHITTFYAAAYNGSDFLSDLPVGWSSSNTTIIQVTPSGSSTIVSASTRYNGSSNITMDAGGNLTNFTQVTVLPPEVDYILIRNLPNGSGINLCHPMNYPGYPVGHGDTLFGARYNLTSGYMEEVPITSSWTSSNTDLVDVSSPGISASIICNDSNYGDVTITLDDGEGHENTTVISVLKPAEDYLQIRDAPGGLGNISVWDNFTLNVSVTKSYYVSAYNLTAGYIGEISATWTLTGDLGGIEPDIGSSTNFTAEDSGSGALFANHSLLSCSTVITVDPAPEVITMTPPTRLKAVALEGGGALTLSWDPYTGDDFAGFNLYRSTDANSGFELVNTEGLITGTTYTDSGLSNDVTYYYYITALDNATVPDESDPSLIASGTPVADEVIEDEEEDLTFIVLLSVILIILIILFILILKWRRKPKIVHKTFVEMENPSDGDALPPNYDDELPSSDEDLGHMDEDILIEDEQLPIFEDEGEYMRPGE